MPTGVANGYQGGNAVGIVDDGYSRYLKVYNGTGSAVSEGAVYVVSFADDTDGYFPKLLAAATGGSQTVMVGVVCNYLNSGATIASDAWGWVQTRGYCEKVTVASGGVTDGDTLELINATAVGTTEGAATVTVNSFAIAKETIGTSGTGGVFLLGNLVTIAAS